jgi:hypothetical protein
MRVWFSLAAALGLALAALVAAPGFAAEPDKSEEGRKSKDWPRERIIVRGERGGYSQWLVNHTLRGTEGFADGSAPSEVQSRTEYSWQVYYAPGGKLEAHFSKIGARTPHGALEVLDYVEYGTWRINEDDDLCQTIPKVGWGVELCFYIERRGRDVAFYYTRCGAFNRCYAGRLGPVGTLYPGRAFTR